MEQTVEQTIQERDVTLRNLSNMNTLDMEKTIIDLQEEHQHLVMREARSADGAEQGYYRRLIKRNEAQRTMVQVAIDRRYQEKVKQVTPKAPLQKNITRSFLVGGLICAFGQLIINTVMLQYHMEFKMAAPIASITIVILTGILTGIGVYDEIGRFGGAGSMVPISGFANSVVSAALEFKREGMIYGIGAKIFQIAGPVILYGTLASVAIGLMYYMVG